MRSMISAVKPLSTQFKICLQTINLSNIMTEHDVNSVVDLERYTVISAKHACWYKFGYSTSLNRYYYGISTAHFRATLF